MIIKEPSDMSISPVPQISPIVNTRLSIKAGIVIIFDPSHGSSPSLPISVISPESTVRSPPSSYAKVKVISTVLVIP